MRIYLPHVIPVSYTHLDVYKRQVFIFRRAGQAPIKMLSQNIESLRNVLRDFADPTGLDAIERYFTFFRTLLGDDALDEQRIIEGFTRGIANGVFPFARCV